MLVCNVSLRPRRSAIVAEMVEVGAAVDALGTGQIVFATLVDDPASVGELVDAYLGEIMLEAASAADTPDATIPATITATINEAATADSTQDASPAIATTWNPADKTSANVVLSNGNLTVLCNINDSQTQAVRATISKTSGKWYFESKMNVVVNYPEIGIATSAALLTSVGNTPTAASLCNCGSGNLFVNNVTVLANIGVHAVNDICCIAVDMDNKRIWYRKNNGIWNNSGTANPATNTGGLDISPAFGSNAAYPIASFALNSLSSQQTTNFGATAFTYTAPSGFSAWA